MNSFLITCWKSSKDEKDRKKFASLRLLQLLLLFPVVSPRTPFHHFSKSRGTWVGDSTFMSTVSLKIWEWKSCGWKICSREKFHLKIHPTLKLERFAIASFHRKFTRPGNLFSISQCHCFLSRLWTLTKLVEIPTHFWKKATNFNFENQWNFSAWGQLFDFESSTGNVSNEIDFLNQKKSQVTPITCLTYSYIHKITFLCTISHVSKC